jgi:hypothetical protein
MHFKSAGRQRMLYEQVESPIARRHAKSYQPLGWRVCVISRARRDARRAWTQADIARLAKGRLKRIGESQR